MHSIIFRNTPVGHAQIIRQGLYFKIHCQCVLPDKGMYRIKVSDGISDADLGICVPEGDKFVLTTRVPIKKLSGENLNFTITMSHPLEFPVTDRKSFDGLDKLKTARLQCRNGQQYIVID